MRNYSYLLFLSSVLAADNNTLVHMAQEQLTVQIRSISLFFASIVGAGLASALKYPAMNIALSLSLLNAILGASRK
jgi:hypothetical protein